MVSLINLVKVFAIAHTLFGSGCCVADNITNYISNKNLIDGLVFPSEIDAVVGEEIYFKIVQPVANQNECHYRKTGGNDVNVQRPHKQHLEQWKTETCGLCIRNITIADQGIWRLTSTNQNNVTARGIVFIRVRDDVKHQETIDVKSIDTIELAEQPTYCYVTRPTETKTIYPHHEKCVFPKFQNDVESIGRWNVMYGAKGKTREMSLDINVQANVEQIQTFSEFDEKSSTLNMKCTLANSNRSVTFCRFLRFYDDLGFNLGEGRGNEQYQYFGNGLEHRECGISIRNPSAQDRTTWKCFIGVKMSGMKSTVGAIINASQSQQTEDDIEGDDVFGLEGTQINILCKRKSPTDYCWFRDPSGKKLSLSDRIETAENDTYRYYGTGIQLGECGITIMNATHDDSGVWSCHMGVARISGIDKVKEINVRVTESSLVSTYLFQDAEADASLLLECRSIPEHRPLDYCRFVLPDGTGFSVNEQNTIHNPHMQLFYFNPNRQMKSGYCSLIVKTVKRAHHGQWTCAARLTADEHESFDEFRINVYQNGILSARFNVIAFSVAFILSTVVVLGFLVYKKRCVSTNQRRQTTQSRVTYITSADQVSISSGRSNEHLELQNIQASN